MCDQTIHRTSLGAGDSFCFMVLEKTLFRPILKDDFSKDLFFINASYLHL